MRTYRYLALCIWFWNDPTAWTSAVGEHHLIDFVGLPVGTPVTTQFQSMGVTFTNFVFIHDSAGFSDGFGLSGNNGIRLQLDRPHHAIGVDHLGVITFALYHNGVLVGVSDTFWYGPAGAHLTGVISEQPFDEVYMFKPQPPHSSNIIGIDNVYWGMRQGDLNGDGVVNVFDLLILLGQWGTCDDEAPCPADLDNNGVVNVLDLLILLGNWG
jgi:hypothetical protein